MNDDRAWIAIRKGLFELRRTVEAWRIERVSFLGEPVSMVLPPRGPRLIARCAKVPMGSTSGNLWSSVDAGDRWQAVSQHRRRSTRCVLAETG